MSDMIAVISIAIGINALLNVIWLFLLRDIIKRIERIENLFINKNL